MNELSLSPSERARNAHSRVLQALSPNGTARKIAESLGTSETTISRIKGEMENALTVLYQLGFKVVPFDQVCVNREVYEATVTIATHALGNEETARSLLMGEEVL